MTERERAITNLMAVDLRGGSHEMLSSIAKAIHKPTCGGWTIGACQVLRDTLVNLLSETDEEALREAYTKGREDGMGMANRADMVEEAIQHEHESAYDEGYDAGFASADDWCSQHEDEMEKHGWYRALDADKEPIKFGDEVEWRHPCGSCELRHGIVTGIKTDKIGDEVFHEITVKVDRFTVRLMASQLRHYHAPEPDTWERIIKDAVMRGADIQWRAEGGGRMTDYFVPEDYDLVARCKALADGDA